jgi:DNA-directed RNA polymerase subunit RPC12/RpoP
MSDPANWDEWLLQPMGRGHLKRIGQMLDDDAELRGRLLDALRKRGRCVSEDMSEGSGKRLLKHARDREGASRTPSNLIQMDEGFTCGRCGEEVPPLRKTSRDHCPRCLWSMHVDVVPGDRAEDCGGLQRPVGASLTAGVWRIRYRCERCEKISQCRAAGEGTSPDEWESLVALASQGEGA